MRYWVMAVLVVLLGVVAGYWMWLDRQQPAATPIEMTETNAQGTASDNAAAFANSRQQALPPDTSKNSREQAGETESAALTHEERLLKMGYSKEEIARYRKRQQLEQAAQSRFDDTVAMDQLSADDVSPEVRALFSSMMFEPVFNVAQGQEGYVDGLRIAELSAANPFAQAGFEIGDRLVRLNGQALRDPAQIAHLFTALNTSFEACAWRDEQEYCRRIQLPDS